MTQKETKKLNRPKNVIEMEMVATDFLSTLFPNKPGLWHIKKRERKITVT